MDNLRWDSIIIAAFLGGFTQFLFQLRPVRVLPTRRLLAEVGISALAASGIVAWLGDSMQLSPGRLFLMAVLGGVSGARLLLLLSDGLARLLKGRIQITIGNGNGNGGDNAKPD